MKKVFVLMAACIILATPSFAQKDKTIKKGGDRKEMVKPRRDKKEVLDRHVKFNIQEMEKKHDKMFSIKQDVLCKELNLEGEIRDKFLEVYKNYDAEMFKTELEIAEIQNKVFSQNTKALKENDLLMLSEDEARMILDKSMEMEKIRFEITEKYLMKFQEIIKTQGVLKLKEAEKKFEQIQMTMEAREKEKRDKLFTQPAIKKNN